MLEINLFIFALFYIIAGIGFCGINIFKEKSHNLICKIIIIIFWMSIPLNDGWNIVLDYIWNKIHK